MLIVTHVTFANKAKDRLFGFCHICGNDEENAADGLIFVNELCVKVEGKHDVTRRHWSCVNKRFFQRLMRHMGTVLNDSDLSGISALNQDRIRRAWNAKCVSDSRDNDEAVIKMREQQRREVKTAYECRFDVMFGNL